MATTRDASGAYAGYVLRYVSSKATGRDTKKETHEAFTRGPRSYRQGYIAARSLVADTTSQALEN
jgi:hypothetical protein